ncbi:hypothetical protein [Actinomadura spongiicola]|nr:hypothetical protein [Actinomadura spongiicola]
MAAKGFAVELSGYVLTVVAPVDHGPRFMEEVTCRPRRDDGNRPWFFDSRGKPIVEADHITDAMVALSGMLRPTP